ncbi:MAG TPA: hypothetical protein VLC47_09675, partial [Burkholderiales bacterium]|nr:hypothetical protein [Burkholderiales bacterium]
MRRLPAMLVTFAAVCGAVHAESPDVPAPLRDWEDWVLDGREYLRCPIVDGGAAGSAEHRICAWPGPLAIDAGAHGASFAQPLQVFAPGFVPLPGDDTVWPQDVVVDGRAAPVVGRGGRPHLWLAAGTHRVSGRLVWSAMPESLPIPAAYSLIELTVQGSRVEWPERSGDSLRLGAAREPLAQVDQLDTQVYRKLTDAIPGLLRTRVTLNVAGRAREELIGPLLPAGFLPMQLDAPLPVRLQPDGRLRVQVRPGTWTLELVARSASALEAVRVPASGVPSEVWSFEAIDRLRSVTVEGLEGIDPAEAN